MLISVHVYISLCLILYLFVVVFAYSSIYAIMLISIYML